MQGAARLQLWLDTVVGGGDGGGGDGGGGRQPDVQASAAGGGSKAMGAPAATQVPAWDCSMLSGRVAVSQVLRCAPWLFRMHIPFRFSSHWSATC